LRTEEDKLGTFIEECCVLRSDASVGKRALYQTYRLWYERNYGPRYVLSERDLAQQIKQLVL